MNGGRWVTVLNTGTDQNTQAEEKHDVAFEVCCHYAVVVVLRGRQPVVPRKT
jgi:hypothetical protein